MDILNVSGQNQAMHASGNKRVENGMSTPRRVIADVTLLTQIHRLISKHALASVLGVAAAFYFPGAASPRGDFDFMIEENNPYTAPRSDTKSTTVIESFRQRRNYISETLFVLVFMILLFSAFVQPRDATNVGVYVSVIWLSCWLSSLFYKRMKINRDIQSMRGVAMLIGLVFAIVATYVLHSKPVALAAGVLMGGVGTLFRYARARPHGQV